jgi:hypothetical protein
MKTLTINNKMLQIVAGMLVVLMVGFSHLAQAAQTSPAFDHSRTGFLLKDVHTTLKCEQCHVDGIFKNTPKDCAGCHTTGSRVGAKPRPINHVPTSSACDTCHISAANFLVKSYNHMGITGGCSTCHNGQSLGVLSKPVTHFPTTQPCELCHTNTTSFLSWQMGAAGHVGITTGCAQCHQGQFPGVVSMPPVPTAHIPVQAGQDCSACHSLTNFTNFLGATFNHLGITTTCASCHSGQMPGVVVVPPVPSKHITIPAGTDCGSCHTNTVNFLGAFYAHPAPLPACDTCHTGAYPGVKTKPANHIPTSASTCDVCHTAINTVGYTSFTGSAYHISVTAPAGGCASCHTGSYGLGFPSGNGLTSLGVGNAAGGHIPLGGSSCDVCHTANNTALYTSFTGATLHLSQTVTAGTCTNCHTGTITTNSASGVPPYGKAYMQTATGTVHVTTTASCETCHTQATTANYTTFLGAIYTHPAGVAGTCSNCHNGTNAKGKPATHLTTALQCDTAGCHTATTTSNYTTFLGGTVHPGSTVAAGTCGTLGGCHSATVAPGLGVAALGMPTAPAHPPIGAVTQCDSASGCHSSAASGGYVRWSGTMYHPSGLSTAGTCGQAGCHDGSSLTYNAQGIASFPGHLPVTGAGCDSCHSNTTNFTTWLGAAFVHSSAQNGTCLTCHNGTAALGTPAQHIPAAGQQCDVCHTGLIPNVSNNPAYAGLASAWVGATYTHATTVAGNCISCHNGTYPGVSSQTSSPGGLAGLNGLPHTVTSAQCDTCHTLAISMYTSATPTWAGAGFNHTGAASGSCINSGCHGPGGTGKGVSVNHIITPSVPSCDSGGCHKVFGGTVTSFAGGIWNHSVAPFATSRCDSCHNGSYTAFGTFGAIAKVANHIPTTMAGTNDCNFCHVSPGLTPPTTAATAGAAAWVSETVGVTQHGGFNGGGSGGIYCVTCHLSSASYLSSKIQKVSHNGASTAKDCSSSSCHKPLGGKGTSWSKWT